MNTNPENTGVSTIHTPRLNLIELAEQNDRKKTKKWSIRLSDQNEPVGECGFYEKHGKDFELFYGIEPEYRDNGFATEAVSGVITYGFLGLGIVEYKAAIKHRNHPSIKVMTKCGASYADTEMREVGNMLVTEVPIYHLGYTAFKNSQEKLFNQISWSQ